MKLSQQVTAKAILSFYALLSLQHLVHADLLKLARSYSLTLSCLTNTDSWSPNVPYITLNLANPTPHTLFFPYAPGIDPNFVVFSVEYKVPTGNPKSNSGWKQVSPNVEKVPGPKPSTSGPVIKEITNKQRIVIPSGQEGHLSIPPNFPMSKMGLYRVKATLTVPEASEYNGVISPSTKIRSFNLVVSSNTFVVRHTVAGFAEVLTAAGKPASTR